MIRARAGLERARERAGGVCQAVPAQGSEATHSRHRRRPAGHRRCVRGDHSADDHRRSPIGGTNAPRVDPPSSSQRSSRRRWRSLRSATWDRPHRSPSLSSSRCRPPRPSNPGGPEGPGSGTQIQAAISPDGRQIVVVARAESGYQLVRQSAVCPLVRSPTLRTRRIRSGRQTAGSSGSSPVGS